MKKKITAFLLALIMCISFSTVAFAAGEENSYIIDEIGCLNESQIDHLNEYGEYLPKGHKKGISLKVLNLETNEEKIFESIRLASRYYKISRNKINNHINKCENEFVIEQYQITILN